MMTDSKNYFEQLSLAPSFEVDLSALGANYRELAKSVHPDRFVAASDAERREALARAAVLNDAYQTLKSTTARAMYLLKLQGRSVSPETTIQDGEFLFQQMEWREELEELQALADLAAIAPFKKRLAQARAELDQLFAGVWNDTAQLELAEKYARRMQFLDKLTTEIRQLEERLDD